MLKEFKEFLARGNVIDLAVAVIIGVAFGSPGSLRSVPGAIATGVGTHASGVPALTLIVLNGTPEGVPPGLNCPRY
jgi:large conductance mechanosensitive channel